MAENTKNPNEMVFNDYYDASFLIFLEFFPNLDCFKEIQKKYDWRGSLQTKINAVSVLSEDVKTQYEKAMKAKEEIEKKGFCSGLESTLLLIKFETMLNSVYSLCDNLAFIGQRLHPGIARLFNEQRKKIEKYQSLYPNYSEYLNIIQYVGWYENLHKMRTESTHYLPGFVYHSQNGLGILYQNMEHLDNSDEKIEIENIRDYVIGLLAETNDFLEKYGRYHLKQFIAEDHTTFHPCLIPNPAGKGFLAGGRVITYSEYMKKLPGKCQYRDIPCPRKNNCPAYLKSEESTVSESSPAPCRAARDRSRVNALFECADAIEREVSGASRHAEVLTQAILAKAFRVQLVESEVEKTGGSRIDR